MIEDIAKLEAKLEKLNQDIMDAATNSEKLNELTKEKKRWKPFWKKKSTAGFYLMILRKKSKLRTGNKFLQEVSDCEKKSYDNTLLCRKNGAYLMLHRVSKKNDVNKDKWIGIFGGNFEEGGSPEECLLREAYEKTGSTLTSCNSGDCYLYTERLLNRIYVSLHRRFYRRDERL